jgi:monoamine oxidase
MNHQILDYLSTIHQGLQPKATRAKVVIVGAGIAGLVAGYELTRAGHEVIILEARQRVGGRVYTLREPFTNGVYAEAGAMRVPQSHLLTLAYIDKFKLGVSSFKIENPQAYYYLQGQRYRIAEANAHPERLGFVDEQGKTVFQLWEEALRPIVERLKADGETAWPEIAAQYDRYSIHQFLRANHWSTGAIEMFGLLLNQEGLMNTAFLELLREEVGHYYTNLVQIDGGMDRLPQAFLPTLQSRIRFGAAVTAVDQSPESVTVHYHSLAQPLQITADYAILAIPFPALRHVEALKPFSRAKQRAIRQLHYEAATKVLLQCRRRFWEEDDGIFGGATITDLPIRNIYYPEHGRETGRGVLLASYTWGEDARGWGSLKPADRVAKALENLAHIHPQVTQVFEVGDSKAWQEDEFTGGAFAVFDPYQETLLYEHIVAPEGRFHFAGEHASLTHTWIQGAIESGVRAACEIHSAQIGENS